MNQNDKNKRKNKTAIQKKRYYRIEFCLSSAMAVGSGQNIMTDKDIIRNSIGEPYIPGTALAGIYRTFFENPDEYFGSLQAGNDSKIITYDACLLTENPKILTRDCVGLDQYKTGIPGAKFDFEILEPGTKFVTYLEQNEYIPSPDQDRQEEKTGCIKNAADVIAAAWMQERIVIGAKGARGLGQITDVRIYVREFDFSQPSDINDWIDFDLYREDSWNKEWKLSEADILRKECGTYLSILLEQKSPLTIRAYTTDVGDDVPDYKQVAYIRDGKEIPIIPGTSWAGAFRHHMGKMLRNPEALKQLFGSKPENNKNIAGKKSAVMFCESEIRDAESKIVTRNAIDRFSGGTVDGALFTEKSCIGGNTLLKIRINEENVDEDCIKALAASIVDLDLGFLAVGGETSVGHGIFGITEITVNGSQNLKMQKPEDTYQKLVFSLLDRH